FSALTAPDTVVLTSTAITSWGLPGLIGYRATGGTLAGGLTLTTGSGADTVYVESTLAGASAQVLTDAGDDTIAVSSDPGLLGGLLSGVAGSLTVDAGAGSNKLTLSDRAQTAGNQFWVTDHGIAGSVMPFTVLFRASGGNFNRGIALVTGGGIDVIIVQSQFAGAPTAIYTNGGDDVFHVGVNANHPYQGLALRGGGGAASRCV